MKKLWTSDNVAEWTTALKSYDDVVAGQGVARLAALDDWYRKELPHAIAARRRPHITHAEIVKAAEWGESH